LSDFKQNLNSSANFIKNPPNTEFYKNASSGSRVVQCAQTDGQTGMTWLEVYSLQGSS